MLEKKEKFQKTKPEKKKAVLDYIFTGSYP